MENSPRILKNLAIGILVLALYFVAGKLGLSLAFVNESATAVWPPTGIALAALIILGLRFWPAIFLGAFLVNLTTSGDIATSLGIALGNTLEGVVGAYLINRFAGGTRVFDRPLDVFKYGLFAGVISTMVSATIGVGSLLLGGLAAGSQASSIWFTWWLGDLGGALVAAPFLILWTIEGLSPWKWDKKKIFEGLVFLFCLFLSGQAVFGNLFVFGSENYPVAFLSLPVVLWAVFRFSRSQSATAIVMLLGLAVWGTLNGFGPFALKGQNESLLLLQAFMAIISLLALVLSSAIWENKKNEGRFRALIEKSSDAISLIDEKTNVVYTSPSTQRVLGYTAKEFLGVNGLSLVDPGDQQRIANLLKDLVRSEGKVIDIETRIRRKDGGWIWVEAVLSNLLNEPAVGALVVNYRDITENKKAQENLLAYAQRLAEEKAKAEVLLDSIGDGIVAADKAGKVILTNKAFEYLTGWQAKDSVGKFISQLMIMENEHGAALVESDHPLNLALSKGEKITGNYYVLKKDKVKFPAAITATPVRLNNEIIGGIKILRDITVQKQIDKAKSEFVSLASHQLRTPLTVMKWQTAELMDELELAEEKMDFKTYKRRAKNVYVTNQRMIELVNAILNLSKIDLGTLAIEPEECFLNDVLDRLLEEFEEEVRVKKLKLRKIYPANLPKVNIDPKLVRIILQNLLTNAIKYTAPRGQVSLKAEVVNNHALFTITDTGCGIPVEDQGKIFNKFFRTEMARQIDPNGNGLGMYVVKAIVTEIKGKIWFESKVDKGTTFYVKLPLNMKIRSGARDLNESFF